MFKNIIFIQRYYDILMINCRGDRLLIQRNNLKVKVIIGRKLDEKMF